jgi:D-3-phosphoglycerate dehydrogenase / 2-oxoglutarate reductase
MNNKRVLIAASISHEFTAFLQSKNVELIEDFLDKNLYQEVVGIVTSTKLILNQTLLQQMPSLQWIARLGSGMEIIDVDYCNAHQIKCFNSPNGIANAVAEHTIAMIIGLQKNIFNSTQEVRLGKWIREPNRGWELAGKTFGIIGYGATGKAVAQKLSVFGVNTIIYDIKPQETTHGTLVSLATIYQQADIISYHVPLNEQTTNYYRSEFFQRNHILINTSRGPIAQTSEILKGFENKKLLGACLDVLDFEQIQPFTSIEKEQINNLLRYPCIITPHIAGYSFNAINKMCAELQAQLTAII